MKRLQTLPKEKRSSSDASKGIAYCEKMFHLEKHFALLCPKERQEKRADLSEPLMETFFAWNDSLNALPKTLLGKAVYYAQSQRKYLKIFLLDGRLEISNNRAGNSIRPFATGRKNWMLSNTPNGTKALNGANLESLLPDRIKHKV